MPVIVLQAGPLSVWKAQFERYTMPGIVRVKPGEHCGDHSVSLYASTQDSRKHLFDSAPRQHYCLRICTSVAFKLSVVLVVDYGGSLMMRFIFGRVSQT